MKTNRLTFAALRIWLWAIGMWALPAMAADTNPKAVSDLLDRIGGSGTAERFVTVVDETMAENGKEVFVITARDGKPCIKGSTTLAVTTGINWYLNHTARVNISWNNLTQDLSAMALPLPTTSEVHLFVLHVRVDVGTLATGDRLDGASRHQPAVADSRP